MTRSSPSRIERRQIRVAHAHKRVAEVAKELTHDLFDRLMQNPEIEAAWKARFPEDSTSRLEDRFVDMYWGKAIPAARATLAGLLRSDLPEALKSEIFEALSNDATMTRGRSRGGSTFAVDA